MAKKGQKFMVGREKFNHFIFEIYAVSPQIFENNLFEKKAISLINKLGLKVVNHFTHRFSPKGTTSAFILATSHLVLHTWPEYNYVHIDLFCCNKLGSISKLKRLINGEYENSKVLIRRVKYD